MTERSELRRYGVLMAAALSIAATVAILRGRTTTATILFVIGGGFLLMGAFVPSTLRNVHRGWMVFGRMLAWVNTRILLGVLFYAVLGPISIIMRALGRDVLRLRLDRSCSSYWQVRDTAKPARGRYEHLY